MDKKRVAIIGAGVSGITAVKWCTQYGFDAVCFEKQSDIGGLWRYRETDCEGEACVMKSTVINTSKEMTAFSDFPPPSDYANFMHNRKMLAYLRSYAEHFEVTDKIRFDTKVDSVRRANEGGQWIVSSTSPNGTESSETFDGMMLCTGHHVDPYLAHFQNEKVFEGDIIHSHSYKDHRGYEDKNVLVVGVGNSGGDIAVELSRICAQVYLVARRGTWVMNRIFDRGYPLDITMRRRALNAVKSVTPQSMLNAFMTYKLNSRFDHKVYGLQPAHGPFAAHPTVNDELPNRIACGTIRIKPSIDQFTGPKSIRFSDGTEIDDIDTVILATGYSFSFPLLEDGKLVPVNENRVDLFKYMYAPNIDNSETLAIIGLVQPLGSVVPISEMQARVFCHMLNGDGKLPCKSIMMSDINEKHENMKKQFVASRRHTIQVDFGDYMDQLAQLIGCKPDALSLLAAGQIRLALDVLFQPQASYQYRLVGPHPWNGAACAMREINKRVIKATESSVTKIYDSTCGKCGYNIPMIILACLAMWMIFAYIL